MYYTHVPPVNLRVVKPTMNLLASNVVATSLELAVEVTALLVFRELVFFSFLWVQSLYFSNYLSGLHVLTVIDDI